MTWKNSYPTGTEVTFYASSHKRSAATSCSAIMAAGPVDRWEHHMGASTMVMLAAYIGDPDYYLIPVTDMQCIVEKLSDGLEVGSAVYWEAADDPEDNDYGKVVAGPMERTSADEGFDVAVRSEGKDGEHYEVCVSYSEVECA